MKTNNLKPIDDKTQDILIVACFLLVIIFIALLCVVSLERDKIIECKNNISRVNYNISNSSCIMKDNYTYCSRYAGAR